MGRGPHYFQVRMSLTVHRVADWAGVTLGNDGEHPLSIVDIANQAGEHIVNSHPWRWLSIRRVLLNLRGSFTFADATSNGGGDAVTGRIITASLAEVGEYTHVPGDVVNITAGTDANGQPVVTGEHQIIYRRGSDIVTQTSLHPEVGGGQNDIDGTITCDTVALPSDFRSTIPVSGVNSTADTQLYGVTMVSLSRIQEMRGTITEVTDRYYGAINWTKAIRTRNPHGTKIADGIYTPPTPILEIFPAPTAAVDGALTLVYRSGWTRVDEDNDDIVIPEWMEAAYITLFQAFALGYLEADEKPMVERIMEWEISPILEGAKSRDGEIQSSYRQIRNGAMQRAYHPTVVYQDPVGGPS